MTDEKKAEKKKVEWKMPEWMEPYREYINNTGGNSVEDLINDGGQSTVFNNAPRAMLCVAVHSQVALLNMLHGKGKLK